MTLHLMDFDTIKKYRLVISGGPFSSESWKVVDELDKELREVVSYEMKSDSVSEEHKIVLKYDDRSTLELAVVGCSS